MYDPFHICMVQEDLKHLFLDLVPPRYGDQHRVMKWKSHNAVVPEHEQQINRDLTLDELSRGALFL